MEGFGDQRALLTPERVAELTGLHYITVLEKLRAGELVGMKLGSRWRVHPDDYEAWLESKRHRPPTAAPTTSPPRPAARAKRSGSSSYERLTAIAKQR